jgi:DNA-binding SARP family transcriptional activator
MDSDEPSARICLLGKPALYIGGRLEPFGGPRKAIALLAYVLLHRERALARAAVAEQFWPDEEDESARASLRRHLYRALAALPEAPPKRPWVIADKVTLRWNPEAPLELDTQAYERLSSSGKREAAVGLYRGEYLEDFYDEWVLPERERLRDLQSANLVALVDERRRALDYPGAIAFAQALLRLDPLREDAIRRLMSLRFAAGDRSGALADFETFGRRLRDELSIDPMPETIALREAIRSNDLNTLESGRLVIARTARPAFPFAGRSAPMQALRAAWEAAARGTATTAIVSGEAGIGKSRLIAELVTLAEAQGGRVMFGSTATIETEPYQPVAEALRGALPLLRFDRLEPVKLAALSSLIPELRELAPNVPELPQLEPERDRQRLFDAVESAIGHLAEKRPLIELLEFLLRRLRGKSVLALISFREEDVDTSHALRGFLRRLESAHARHVTLGPLEEDDVRALVAGIATEERDALARELFAASEGNALFVTELLRDRLSGISGAAVPAGITNTVVARVERLSPPARSLVETAAVVGSGFDAEVVRQVCGWSFAEVFDSLDELLDRALVRTSPQRRGDFAFSHQLVHAAVYAAVEETARRGLHRRVARTIEGLFPERPSLGASVARHFDAAGFEDEAVARYLPAVRYALDVFAQSEAIALASRALEICSNARDRFELHRLREEAQRRAGDGAARGVDCRALLELAEQLGDDDLLGTALYRTITRHRQLGERADEQAAILRLRALGERAGSPRWALEGALAQARLEINHARMAAAEAIFADAEPLADAAGDDALGLEFWVLRANTALGTPRAREFLQRARPFIGDKPTLGIRWLRAEANVADHAGDPETLQRVAGELLQRYLEMGDLDGQASAHLQLALSAWYRLDVAAVREHNRQALELFERVRKPNSIAAVLINRGVVSQRLGDFTSAEADYRMALSISKSIGQHAFTFLAMLNFASTASMRDEHARARELALEALVHARQHGLDREEYEALGYLGMAERDLGLFVEAREHLEATLCYRRSRDPNGTLGTLIEIIPVRLGLGHIDEALAAAAELLEGLEGDRLRTKFPAKALAAAAAAYAAAGQTERAAALRDEARKLLREISVRLPDERSRQGYLSLPFHRAILADGAAGPSALEKLMDAPETLAPYAARREFP